ncbi:hypothetical protein Ciccas_014363 [Cichlidogyrus casuarinus]|uniref:Uncharacterized protein n=1 Tax=Cichlidogyrus casuarinus TaxID=1844966 RepID=A0ABD2PN34_9PLAT
MNWFLQAKTNHLKSIRLSKSGLTDFIVLLVHCVESPVAGMLMELHQDFATAVTKLTKMVKSCSYATPFTCRVRVTNAAVSLLGASIEQPETYHREIFRTSVQELSCTWLRHKQHSDELTLDWRYAQVDVWHPFGADFSVEFPVLARFMQKSSSDPILWLHSGPKPAPECRNVWKIKMSLPEIDLYIEDRSFLVLLHSLQQLIQCCLDSPQQTPANQVE